MKKDRERQFFGLYKDRGVADLCVQALIAKYDLDIFYDDSKNTMSIYLDSYEIDNNTEAASSVPEETLTSTVM